ncbi:MAG: hypothetical protein PHV30_03835 [Candidatus Margulisbacteria bacterium]|nr:hypothetical protein [Candidatus Margulisiibacteriota bacterium]
MNKKIVSITNTYTMADFKDEYEKLSTMISKVDKEFEQILKTMRYALEANEYYLKEKKEELISKLWAIEPWIGPLIKKLDMLRDQEDHYVLINVVPELSYEIEYLSALYTRIFDVFINNAKNNIAPAHLSIKNLSSASIKERESIIEQLRNPDTTVKQDKVITGRFGRSSENYEAKYIELLTSLNILEIIIITSTITGNKALRREPCISRFSSLLRCPGINFYDVLETTPGESVPGMHNAEWILSEYYYDMEGYMEDLPALLSLLDNNGRVIFNSTDTMMQSLPHNTGIISSGKYTVDVTFKRNKLTIPDLRLSIINVARSREYEETHADITVKDNFIYSNDKQIGQYPYASGVYGGIEAIAYMADLRGTFITQTDEQGRLFISGLPRYWQFSNGLKNTDIIIEVDKQNVVFKAADEILFSRSLEYLRSNTVVQHMDKNRNLFREYLWPVLEDTSITVAGVFKDVAKIEQAMTQVKHTSLKIYDEIIKHISYIDLLTTSSEKDKLGEAYTSSRRIGIFLDRLDGSLEHIIEVIAHEALGHIKLRETMGSLTRHFYKTVLRVYDADYLDKNFFTNSRGYYDAEVVDEAYSIVNHIEALMEITCNHPSPKQRDRSIIYLENVKRQLESISQGLQVKKDCSEEIFNLISDLLARASKLSGNL